MDRRCYVCERLPADCPAVTGRRSGLVDYEELWSTKLRAVVDHCLGSGPPKLHCLVRRLQGGSSGWKHASAARPGGRRLSGGWRLSRLATDRTRCFESPLDRVWLGPLRTAACAAGVLPGPVPGRLPVVQRGVTQWPCGPCLVALSLAEKAKASRPARIYG
jgi:hypothetical protein